MIAVLLFRPLPSAMDNVCMSGHMAESSDTRSGLRPSVVPTLALLHAMFLIAGFGTMLLGPILPLLSVRWNLSDSQSGLLLLAQFCGATLGGATVSRRLLRDLAVGLVAGAVGFCTFAFAFSLAVGCCGLLIGGFGVGRMIATTNILAGQRATQQRGSTLARFNFSWSFGALLSPLLAAWLTPHVPLQWLLVCFSAVFVTLCALLMVQIRTGSHSEPDDSEASEVKASSTFSTNVFLYFLVFLFLYGGLETCLSGWLTTYAMRFGRVSLARGEYTMVLLLAGLTGGRALAAWLLVKVEDRTLLRIALALTAIIASALAFANRSASIALAAVLVGVCLAPIFPACFSVCMSFRPPARQAGLVLAASGLGAAALPWCMGIISTHSGSLRFALMLPVVTAICLLAQTMLAPGRHSSHSAFTDSEI